jgi:intein/homing endonuclease
MNISTLIESLEKIRDEELAPHYIDTEVRVAVNSAVETIVSVELDGNGYVYVIGG